jgi:hypothetical protein
MDELAVGRGWDDEWVLTDDLAGGGWILYVMIAYEKRIAWAEKTAC